MLIDSAKKIELLVSFKIRTFRSSFQRWDSRQAMGKEKELRTFQKRYLAS